MSLIACPECGHEVSEYAVACPHCGFPVAREIRETVAELAGAERTPKAVRGKAAAAKLALWADKYHEVERGRDQPKRRKSDSSFIERHKTLVIVFFAVLILIVQLALLYSAVYA